MSERKELIEKAWHVNALVMSKLCQIHEKKQEVDPNNEKQLCMNIEDVETFLNEINQELNEVIYELRHGNKKVSNNA